VQEAGTPILSRAMLAGEGCSEAPDGE